MATSTTATSDGSETRTVSRESVTTPFHPASRSGGQTAQKTSARRVSSGKVRISGRSTFFGSGRGFGSPNTFGARGDGYRRREMERERLGSLLQSYDSALSELYAWDDKAVSDLIIRLEVWRTAAQLELLFLEPREQRAPAPGSWL
jgi:hypothetical protein